MAAAAASASSMLLPARTFSSSRPAPGTAGQCLPRRVGSRPSPSSVCISSGRTWRVEAVRASAGGTGGAPAAALPAALLFDCDGVLVDTEKDGHRISFNETFAELTETYWSYYGAAGAVEAVLAWAWLATAAGRRDRGRVIMRAAVHSLTAYLLGVSVLYFWGKHFFWGVAFAVGAALHF